MKNILKMMVVALALISTPAKSMNRVSEAELRDALFSGFFLGANFGFGVGTIDYKRPGGGIDYEPGMKGFAGGPLIGYMYQIGMFVLGLELMYNFSNIKHVDNDPNQFSFEKRNAFRMAAMLGVVYGYWMAYFKAGWENALFEYNRPNNLIANERHGCARYNGFLIGLGVQTIIASNWILGGEWTTTFFGSKAIDPTAGNLDTQKPCTHAFMFRVGYRF